MAQMWSRCVVSNSLVEVALTAQQTNSMCCAAAAKEEQPPSVSVSVCQVPVTDTLTAAGLATNKLRAMPSAQRIPDTSTAGLCCGCVRAVLLLLPVNNTVAHTHTHTHTHPFCCTPSFCLCTHTVTPPGHFTTATATQPCANGEYRTGWSPPDQAASCVKCSPDGSIQSMDADILPVLNLDGSETSINVKATAQSCCECAAAVAVAVAVAAVAVQ